MKNIDLILEKYWNGESSLEEEKQLKEYFNSANVEESHLPYKELFVFFTKESDIKYAGGDSVDSAKEIPLTRRMIGIAAAVLLLFVGGVWIYNSVTGTIQNTQDSWAAYEVEDPEKAREVAVDALAFLSAKLNKGEENIKTNFKVLEKMPVK